MVEKRREEHMISFLSGSPFIVLLVFIVVPLSGSVFTSFARAYCMILITHQRYTKFNPVPRVFVSHSQQLKRTSKNILVL